MNSGKWLGRSLIAAAMLGILRYAGADDSSNRVTDDSLMVRHGSLAYHEAFVHGIGDRSAMAGQAG